MVVEKPGGEETKVETSPYPNLTCVCITVASTVGMKVSFWVGKLTSPAPTLAHLKLIQKLTYLNTTGVFDI